MKNIETKEDIYKAIWNASNLGTLGLFIGSGFTKNILRSSDKYPAYNWSELLEKCCEKMDIDKNIMKNKGSYPEIASKMCKQYSLDRGIEFIDAVRELKLCICELTVRRRITIGCNSKLKSRLTPIRPRGLACNCTFLSA